MSRIKMGYRIASPKCHSDFKRMYPSSKLTNTQRTQILIRFNQLLVDYLIETGDSFKLPYGLGVLRICRRRPNKRKITTKAGKEMYTIKLNPWATKKAGKPVYFLNLHTDGFYASFRWFYTKHTVTQSGTWSLNMFRDHTRKLAKVLQTVPNTITKFSVYTNSVYEHKSMMR